MKVKSAEQVRNVIEASAYKVDLMWAHRLLRKHKD